MTQCSFCQGQGKKIEWKDTETLRRFISAGMKIKPKRKSGLCAKHQRELAGAVKRARAMALLPFILE